MRSFRTFIPLILTILLWSAFFGGYKFLVKNLTSAELGEDPAVLFERAVALLSIGAFIAYGIGGSIASSFSKRVILLRDAIVAMILLAVHYYYGLHSMMFFTIMTVLIGLFYGVFAIIRTILTYAEMVKTGLPDTVVNGLTTISFIVAFIVGAFMSTFSYEQCGNCSFWIFWLLLVGICVLSFFLRYDEFETYIPIKIALGKFFREGRWIARNLFMIILPAACLWSIATIISMKSIPYAQEMYGITESQSSLIFLFSAVGVIGGSLLSMRLKNRWLWFRIFTYAFAVLIALFHILTISFIAMIIYSALIGTCMGTATNLIDSYYLRFIGEHGMKESGASIKGLCINGSLAFLLFGLQAFPRETHMEILGGLTIALGIFVRCMLPHIKNLSVKQNI